MSEPDYEKYALLLADAQRAYRSDSTYSVDMANQAASLRSRQEARRTKDLDLAASA